MINIKQVFQHQIGTMPTFFGVGEDSQMYYWSSTKAQWEIHQLSQEQIDILINN